MWHPPSPSLHHHRRWRRKLRLLTSVDFWFGGALAFIALLGLVTLVKTIGDSLAICIAGVTC